MPLRVGLFCATVFYATLLRFLYGFFCAWELLCLRAGKTDPKTVSGAASLRFPYDFFDATSQRFFHITSSMRLCRGFSMSFMSLICVFEESSSGHSLLSFLAHFRGRLLRVPSVIFDAFPRTASTHLTANTLCAAVSILRKIACGMHLAANTAVCKLFKICNVVEFYIFIVFYNIPYIKTPLTYIKSKQCCKKF